MENVNIQTALNTSENGKKVSQTVKEQCIGLVSPKSMKVNSFKVNLLVKESKLHPGEISIMVIGQVVSSSKENHQRMNFKNNMKKLWTLKLLTKRQTDL